MSSLSAAFLGLLQGLTEFLPVSSSGHLVLFQQFMELHGDEVFFDLVLHLGTLLPVVWFYRDSLREILVDGARGDGPFFERPGVRLALLIVCATIPTGLMGVLLKDSFEALFATPAVLTITFAITGLLLWSTRGRTTGTIDAQAMTAWHALILGVAQGCAITPGISRSGTTIAVALFLGLTPCHSRTRDVAAHIRAADVVVAAVGIPEFVRGEWLKPGAVVIDVGINRLEDGRLVGDVAFDEALAHASAMTPVPGGVGPMTIAMLMANTARAARARIDNTGR